MTLKFKFQLASSSLILSVVIGMMITLYHDEKRQVQQDIQQEQTADLSKLESVYEQTIVITQDELTLVNFVKSFTDSPVVAYVGWYSSTDHTGFTKYAHKEELVPVDINDPHMQEIMNDHTVSRRRLVEHGNRILELAKPIQRHGFIRLGYSEDVLNSIFQETVQSKLKRILMVGCIAIVFGLILATFLGAALSKPIKLLMNAADSIARGDKEVHLPVRRGDEMGKLMETFNNMAVELAKLDQLKDDFMSHVTHELRSPLTSIIATVELMQENPTIENEPKLKRSVERLSYGSERLNKLVDNILDLMRMKAGKMHFEIQPVNLPILLTEMADFFVPRAQEKDLYIRADVPKVFPLVMADSERIRQVLSNLIYNAIKFTNKGGIRLWVAQKGAVAEVGVSDTGVGIPKDQIGRLFKKFETLSDTRNRVEKPVPGSGLGLNIVLSSITAQGGTVRVESEVDKGSSFIFTLPLASPEIQKKMAEGGPVADSNSSQEKPIQPPIKPVQS